MAFMGYIIDNRISMEFKVPTVPVDHSIFPRQIAYTDNLGDYYVIGRQLESISLGKGLGIPLASGVCLFDSVASLSDLVIDFSVIYAIDCTVHTSGKAQVGKPQCDICTQ